jgi:coenzyme F420 hydrogenase subunit beta
VYTYDFEHLLAEVVDAGICVGCGTCVGSCPTGCLVINSENSLPSLRPDVECINCSICLKVCPRLETRFDELSEQLFGRLPEEDEVQGVVDQYLVGHAADEEMWQRAAGGGIVSGLVTYLLESGEVDGAIMCGLDPQEPWRVIPKIVRNRQEMMANAGTHYSIVPINSILSQIAEEGGRFAFVGSGCHVSGLRKLQLLQSRWKQRIPIVLGLMCNMNLWPSWAYQLMADMGVDDPSTVRDFKYRGRHGAGAEATLKSGERLEMKQYFGFQMFRLAPLYMPEACSLCIDLYAEQADVTVGDYKKENSIALVRSPVAQQALEGAVREGLLQLEPLAADTFKGLSFFYKLKLRRALTLIEERREDGLSVPDYGARERSPDPLWDHAEDKEIFLLQQQAVHEPALQDWFKKLSYWRQYRIGKLHLSCEPRRVWPGGSERAQTFIDREGWEAFLTRG